MSRQSVSMSRHCFSVSSLISLFICHDIVLNVVKFFFYHLPYSLSQSNYQMLRHSSSLLSLVLLQYSFPCQDRILVLLQELFSCSVTTELSNVTTIHLLSNFHCVVTFMYVLQHFSCNSSHIVSRHICEMSRQSFDYHLSLCSVFVVTQFCLLQQTSTSCLGVLSQKCKIMS